VWEQAVVARVVAETPMLLLRKGCSHLSPFLAGRAELGWN
jgi:hypothetical protein